MLVCLLYMCFCSTASFSAGTALSLIGVITIKKAEKKKDFLFASIPLLFGMQQIAEGFVWISFGHPMALHIATYAFLLFSHILWPIYIPLAVMLMEPIVWRRRILAAFVALGGVVSVYFSYYLFTETVQAEIIHKSIAYVSQHFFVYFLLSPYSVATCASCLFSSYRWVNMFGVVTFLAAMAAYHFYHENFVSVWCFFGAMLSAIIYIHFHTQKKNIKK